MTRQPAGTKDQAENPGTEAAHARSNTWTRLVRRSETVRHGPLAYGLLTSGVRPGALLDAASRFGEFTGPVRVLWGEADPFFRTELGRRLSEVFPGGRMTTVRGGRTFLPVDHPGAVAHEIMAAARNATPR